MTRSKAQLGVGGAGGLRSALKKVAARSGLEFERWLASRRDLSPVELRRDLEQLDIDTLDKWAFGVAGDEIVILDPSDLTVVYHDDFANAQYQASRYSGGRARWARGVSLSEPVEVVVTEPGKFVLDDGHHRYLAALLSRRKLSAKIIVRGKPIEVLLERVGSVQKTTAQLNREIANVLVARGDGGR